MVEWRGNGGLEFPLTAGVPQGALLSLTLYNIYIAPIPQPLRHHNHDIIYADDITQIITSPFKKKRACDTTDAKRNRTVKQLRKTPKINQTKYGKNKKYT